MKKVKNFDDSEVNAFQESDLQDPAVASVIAKAKEMWSEICAKNVASYGDRGSCVVGAGIAVYYVPKGCRKLGAKIIIAAHNVAKAQGSVTWEDGMEAVIEFLKENNINAFYEPGWMD